MLLYRDAERPKVAFPRRAWERAGNKMKIPIHLNYAFVNWYWITPHPIPVNGEGDRFPPVYGEGKFLNIGVNLLCLLAYISKAWLIYLMILPPDNTSLALFGDFFFIFPYCKAFIICQG